MRQNAYPAASPESLGLATADIQQTIDDIRFVHGLDLHSFLLLRRGQLLWEEYFGAGAPDKLHVLNSISKSFTATAIGLAEAQGLLTLDDKLYDYFPEYARLCDSEAKQMITLRHLLTMSSGLENQDEEMAKSDRPLEAQLALPVIHSPGTVWNYSTYSTFLLSAVFSKVYPAGIHDYLRRKLFDPLGFGESRWNLSPEGIPLGGTGLFLGSYDLSRFGQLYLQGGLWQGQQLLPSPFIQSATSEQIDTADNGWADPDWHAGYGYQFWINSFGGYRADGASGQYIIVSPEKEIVIVMTSRLEKMQIPLTAVNTHILQTARPL